MSREPGTHCVRCKKEVFHYQWKPDEGDVCMKCLKPGAGGDRKLSTFPFTATNLTSDGSPVEVQSIYHLRRLEREHGVHSGAYN